MITTTPVSPDVDALGTWLPVPGFGVLAVNAFVIRAARPVLVDTGLAALGEAFLKALEQSIDPARLEWIWLTHPDPDHVGNLAAVLEHAPNARVVTTFLGMGKLGLLGLPVDRVHLVNPGQCLDAGDRGLLAVAPPVFDAPESTGLFDPSTGTLFSADCFGALLPAPAGSAAEVDPGVLCAGMIGWATVDAPWLHRVDRGRFRESLQAVTDLQPRRVLSSHLPPAEAMTGTLLGNLAKAPDAPPFIGPDQAALEGMMAA
ncbi:MBL fold metallo-hydrolase [Thioalkalivibrio denitrificans]|uniref:MBL fold metallo-hydrolase n=2 Tax=Thioalkalivibrio denitrificans TaxID=108003 RepID=A0A1V3NF37_9GAMM|nr:MBL fold metallo-hydrolase [Thioalkalivibrio denitrificans]